MYQRSNNNLSKNLIICSARCFGDCILSSIAKGTLANVGEPITSVITDPHLSALNRFHTFTVKTGTKALTQAPAWRLPACWQHAARGVKNFSRA